MSFPYHHVLLIGATSGIGASLANHLIQSDIKVTAVGRRKDRLDAFLQHHASTNLAKAEAFDIANISEIPSFVEKVMTASPDIDCVFLNAGVQGRYDWSKPESIDLAKFLAECNVNFTSMVALTHAVLPYLKRNESKTGIIFTGTHLSIVPASSMSAYSASKAALDAFILCLREQLRKSNVKVVHLSPPPVQTELHDAEMGPEAGHKLGMPLDAFTDLAYKELVSGKENIIIGSVGASTYEQFMEIVDNRKAAFDRLVVLLRSL